MVIKNLSNATPEELIQRTYASFEQKQRLVLHVNRSYTSMYVPKPSDEKPLVVDRQLLDECFKFTADKVDTTSHYFFTDLEGNTCYITDEIVNAFQKRIEENFPDSELKWIAADPAIVDVDTDTALMPADTAPQGYATLPDEDVHLACKVNSFFAQLIPKTN
jgi:hypothetical protein